MSEPTQTLEVIPSGQPPAAVMRDQSPMSVAQMQAGLRCIQEVMRDCMKEGQDYGKVPGCGDKPGLFQPGAQKLSMMFQLNPEVRQETITDYPNFHRGFRLIVRVTNGSKFADGVGECSTLESKYRYRNAGKKCPECGNETIIKGKAEYGGGWLCYEKKGGCGWKCNDGTPAAEQLQSQSGGKVEHDNAPDFWNTVRKMAFKRAFVHAIINATNTSELWSQDLEDLAANGVVTQTSQEQPEAFPRNYKDRHDQTTPRQMPQEVAERLASHSEPSRPEKPAQASPRAGKPASVSSLQRAEATLDSAREWTSGKGVKYVFCHFTTDSGAELKVGTKDPKMFERINVLEGVECELTYKPGYKEGTWELCTIAPADSLP